MPFVYRVHEKPSAEKITAFNEFVKNMGFSIKGTYEPHPKEFARLLDKIKNTPYERIISTALLRSLMKAKYSSQNAGHFSLAFEYYCHFTSPIRRYPDLAIHRIIKEFLNGGLTDKLSHRVHRARGASFERNGNHSTGGGTRGLRHQKSRVYGG